jgi:hypothetical protein
LTQVGPRQISVLDKSAVPIIYGPGTECKKSIWYSQGSYDPDKTHLGAIRDPVKHRRRRRAWDRGMSIKSNTQHLLQERRSDELQGLSRTNHASKERQISSSNSCKFALVSKWM